MQSEHVFKVGQFEQNDTPQDWQVLLSYSVRAGHTHMFWLLMINVLSIQEQTEVLFIKLGIKLLTHWKHIFGSLHWTQLFILQATHVLL